MRTVNQWFLTFLNVFAQSLECVKAYVVLAEMLKEHTKDTLMYFIVRFKIKYVRPEEARRTKRFQCTYQ